MEENQNQVAAAAPAQKGVQNVKEVIALLEYLAVNVMIRLKDGADLGDLVIALDPELHEKAKAAFADIGEVSAELKDLSFEEAGELALSMISLAKKLSAASKQ